jgi:hypothetical protein
MGDRSMQTLAEVIAGDVAQLARLANSLASATLPSLVLHRSAVARAIAGWLDGAWPTESLQAWASLVRRGYVAGTASGPVQPIEITYEADHEELLATVIGRLDELGDLVDGQITVDEANSFSPRFDADFWRGVMTPSPNST